MRFNALDLFSHSPTEDETLLVQKAVQMISVLWLLFGNDPL